MATVGNNKIISLIIAARPWQWVKNAFVVAPLLFSKKFSDPHSCWMVLLATLSFCLASSAIYIINDLCDRGEDRHHPVKRNRPIASGRVNTPEALLLSAALLFGGLAVGVYVGAGFAVILLFYLALNAAYSWRLKHMVILDVMVIAAGFVLRILAGSLAIGVASSHWLILCTTMISLFLGFTKRRAELVATNSDEPSSRLVLKDYSVAFLDQVISMVTGATIICYALYTVDARTLAEFGSRSMLLTVPSVIYGMLRYVYIIYHLEKGADPTGALCKDIPTVLNLALWVAIVFFVIRNGSSLDLFH